jgi:SAM-dependent MidA family methyltransferase
MKAALYDPHEGYYCRPDSERWGREGDYRTSSERSELFAATFARYFAKLHEKLGSPPTWTIVEVGVGAGHFAAELLRTLQHRFPKVFSVTRYVLDEASADSRSRAAERLAPFSAHIRFQRLEELEPLEHAVIFSNELLDAFPVHRVIIQGNQLREFYVKANENGCFSWLIGAPSTKRLAEYLAQLGFQLPEGRIAEINLEVEAWLTLISSKVTEGYLLTVDYGAQASDLYSSPERQNGTLRAFHKHRMIDDVLARPGEQDITSTIEWTAVKNWGKKAGLESVDFQRLDRFLLDSGLLEELELRHDEAANDSERIRISTAVRSMILPDEMATSFSVLVQRKISADQRVG